MQAGDMINRLRGIKTDNACTRQNKTQKVGNNRRKTDKIYVRQR